MLRRWLNEPKPWIAIVLAIPTAFLAVLMLVDKTRDVTTPGPKPVRVILALDTSSSMACPLNSDALPGDGECPRPGTGEIPSYEGRSRHEAATMDGVEPALGYFREGDFLSVWSFDTEVRDAVIQPFDVRQRGGWPLSVWSGGLFANCWSGYKAA